MTAAVDHFRSGNLSSSIAELQREIRSRPADPRLRVFLAQLLVLTGAWERALNQLEVAAELDASALPMKHMYTAAIQCERVRADVFRGKRTPLVLGDPESWTAMLVQSLAALAGERAQEANALRSQALSEAPPSSGALNGAAFEWIADADSRLGPILEVILNGSYYWVPFARMSRIEIEQPADARDLVWLPASFTWSNGGQAPGLIPVRYPDSEASTDDALRMSRKTEWRPIGSGAYAGSGQRILSTNSDEFGLLDIREISFEHPN